MKYLKLNYKCLCYEVSRDSCQRQAEILNLFILAESDWISGEGYDRSNVNQMFLRRCFSWVSQFRAILRQVAGFLAKK